MKNLIYFGLVILILTGSSLAQTTEKTPQPAAKQTDVKPTFTETSPELEKRDQAVDEQDLLILNRASKILSSEAKWNRKDDRVCKPNHRTWSLFCSLQKASIEILGEYQHRRVAMQEVRFAIEDVTNGREFEHRLMDYNNLPTTKFEDIRKILKMATAKVAARLRQKKRV
jgi:hypothetical protein